MRTKPSISLCIPVYNAEQYLQECLDSLARQTFRDFEVIVVDDCSPCSAFDKSAKKIVKAFSHSSKLSVNFIRHSENKGLVEARRTAVYEAKGKYIFILDSDDKLPPQALEILYNKAMETDADIIHGGATVYFTEDIKNHLIQENVNFEKYKADREAKVNNINLGLLKAEDNLDVRPILENYLVEHKHMGFLWGKLIKKEVYIRAFEHISPVFCTMAEDVLQYVWLAYEAKSYYGIEDKVYEYSINTGVSSKKQITEIGQWEKVCSTSSVFTSIFVELENPQIHFTQKQVEAIQYLMVAYIKNNYEQWKKAVADEIKEEAFELLCDYWGRDLVEKVIEAEK